MTISIVQTCNGSGLASTATFGAGVTLGNYLIIATGAYTTTASPPVAASCPTVGGLTPAGNADLIAQLGPSAADTVSCAYWLLPVTAAIAGQSAVQCSGSWTGAAGYTGVVGIETTGWAGVPALDRSVGNGGTTTAVNSGTTPAIQYAPELVIGGSVGFGAVQPTPAPYTCIDATGGDGYYEVGYIIAGVSGGTYSWAGTELSVNNWAAAVATLGVVAAPPSGSTVPVAGGSSNHGRGYLKRRLLFE